MNRIRNNLRAILRLMPNFRVIALSYLIVPVLVLAVFGSYLIIVYGYFFPFIITLAITSLLPLLTFIFRKKQRVSLEDSVSSMDELVTPSSEWGDGDLACWNTLNTLIGEHLSEKSDWPTLQVHALEIIELAATQYGKKALSFSSIEGLILLEELSRRYRQLLLQYVPSVEHLPCSWLRSVYTHKRKIRRGWSVSKGLYDVYRAYRVLTPTGLLSELKSQLQSQVLSDASEGLVFRLKYAFLQEVAAVAIDLYSGRFRVEQGKLKASSVMMDDQSRMAPPLEPLRVCMVGQVSSGKSSVINALMKGSRVQTKPLADVDTLPSTQAATVFQCDIEGVELMHLIDLPGLDGKTETESFMLTHVVNSQVILWVLKANQSARALDVNFKSQLDAYYKKTENISRKRPIIIGVLNQVDRLPPVKEWAPPYDVDNDRSSKVLLIKEALEFNKKLLGIDEILPLSVSENREPYNLMALEKCLNQCFEQAVQVQLNQRRNEAGSDFKLKEQFQRVYRSGKSLFQLIRH